MKELTEWWEEFDGLSRRWLILGKGPSFEARDRYDLRPYTTMAINHVVREMKVDVVSAVNYDVVGDCSDAIYQNSRFLLMPRYPHSIPGDGDHLLETYFTAYPVLEALSQEGRLIWYNLSSDTIMEGSPVIKNGPFSVCILFNLLAQLGVRRIRTLGVDGGLAYASSFQDMTDRTRLANGMTTYDHQFNDMMKTVKQYHLDYAPLNTLTFWQRLAMYLSTPASKRGVRRWLKHHPFFPSRKSTG